MNQIRQFTGYLIFFLAASMLWQTWQQEQKVVEKTPEDAASHMGEVAKLSSLEVAPAERVINVNTDLITMKIDKLGGRIVELNLLDYKKEKGSQVPSTLLGMNKEAYLTSQFGYTGDASVTFSAPQKSYKMRPGSDELKVEMSGVNSNGVAFVKTFTFSRGKYQFVVDAAVKNGTDRPYSGHVYGQFRQFVNDKAPATGNMVQRFIEMTRFNTFTGASYYSDEDSYVKLPYKTMDDQVLEKSVVGGWIAVQKPYFLGAWVPQNNQSHHLYTDKKPAHGGSIYTIGMLGKQVVVTQGGELTSGSIFYGGPEITKVLKNISKGLDLTIDYGWLWMLSNAIFWLLDFFYGFIGNWGIAIILVTLTIKAAFYKMSEASYRSISRMKKIQPRLEALKSLHGDDREKLGLATRELFQKEKVNPIGGCLPIIIQIPFFIALYYVLIESVQLRHAPFMLWIQDLSAPDPYYVLPIIMGLSMLVQQSLNPKPEDPVQEKMMYIFPVFLTFMFLSFPAGLVIYWVTNNVLSIWQQWYVSRKYS